MKMITLSMILALLVGCTPATPSESAARSVHKGKVFGSYIKDNSFEVCIRGNTHLYIESGNASQALLLLDKDSKVIPCEESLQ